MHGEPVMACVAVQARMVRRGWSQRWRSLQARSDAGSAQGGGGEGTCRVSSGTRNPKSQDVMRSRLVSLLVASAREKNEVRGNENSQCTNDAALRSACEDSAKNTVLR